MLAERNALWALGGQAAGFVIQATSFVLLARSLGPIHYGAFIAVLAFAQVFSPFVGLGYTQLLIKNVSRDPKTFAKYWRQLLFLTTSSGFLSVLVVALLAGAMLPGQLSWPSLVAVAVSELLLFKVVECSIAAFQSMDRQNVVALLTVLGSTARLSAIALLTLFDSVPTVDDWAIAYLASTFATSVAALMLVQRYVKVESAASRIRAADLKEGLSFAFTISARTIFNDIDKTLLARLVSTEAAGLYGASYRLIDVATIPVRAATAAGYTHMFRAGQNGLDGAAKYAQRLLPQCLAYSFCAATMFALGAPLITKIIGSDYADSTEAIRWLAVVPLARALHLLTADALAASGHHTARAIIQVTAAAVNVALNLWLIPLYSWRGAAWATIASELSLALLLILAVVSLRRTTKQGSDCVTNAVTAA